MRAAYFVSSHGFGHAARACAVIDAVWRQASGPETVNFDLFTSVPRWFFDDSLRPAPGALRYRDAPADVGLVQTDALAEDIAATVAELERRIPYQDSEVDALAGEIRDLGAGLVICDIAPLGLAVARRADVPSLLIENFTWDWIYRHYRDAAPAIVPIADYLGELFGSAGHHLRTEPCCGPSRAEVVPPVARRPRSSRDATRERLGVPADARMALVTMGGIEWDYGDLAARIAGGSWWLVVPGGSPAVRRRRRIVLLPHRSDFYHPDLIHAADGVVGKLGYSTLAEVYSAGLPFGYVPRPSFPESAELERWVQRRMPHLQIEAQRFVSGTWLERVDELLALPHQEPSDAGGADVIAARVLEILRS